MPNNITPDIRALPLYLDGVRHGTDIGIAIAMTAITAERIHQEQLGDADGAGSDACRVYADGALLASARCTQIIRSLA